MIVSLTPKQISAIHARLTSTCTYIEVRRWHKTGNTIEVSQFARTRLIETVKIGPSGIVKVLS
jgi:hypothetical protein